VSRIAGIDVVAQCLPGAAQVGLVLHVDLQDPGRGIELDDVGQHAEQAAVQLGHEGGRARLAADRRDLEDRADAAPVLEQEGPVFGQVVAPGQQVGERGRQPVLGARDLAPGHGATRRCRGGLGCRGRAQSE
jgi:hypothetical protein